ncbi:putative leucine-rich repeat-containing protein DDB_G0290503 [Hydractinia symbiolongicarpus]|uniref:putative leucine-rich repeat-containing protein DDB_G0290503 n=1 Tax=Hydractinia symbiolongicarpus TaxID=13093 RepID=UPI00254D069D|nr:putative leucine-rich repeat-containing protein DDB_G0290503 [Hydractinia symbiolongicarpus]XP_057290507.1 putative leucine-rich repeat-containing protein DDB_G0290503 [Hydractinia symbiolongicarpus]
MASGSNNTTTEDRYNVTVKDLVQHPENIHIFESVCTRLNCGVQNYGYEELARAAIKNHYLFCKNPRHFKSYFSGNGLEGYYFLKKLIMKNRDLKLCDLKAMAERLERGDVVTELNVLKVNEDLLKNVEEKDLLEIGRTFNRSDIPGVNNWTHFAAYFKFNSNEISAIKTRGKNESDFNPSKRLFQLIFEQSPKTDLSFIIADLDKIYRKDVSEYLLENIGQLQTIQTFSVDIENIIDDETPMIPLVAERQTLLLQKQQPSESDEKSALSHYGVTFGTQERETINQPYNQLAIFQNSMPVPEMLPMNPEATSLYEPSTDTNNRLSAVSKQGTSNIIEANMDNTDRGATFGFALNTFDNLKTFSDVPNFASEKENKDNRTQETNMENSSTLPSGQFNLEESSNEETPGRENYPSNHSDASILLNSKNKKDNNGDICQETNVKNSSILPSCQPYLEGSSNKEMPGQENYPSNHSDVSSENEKGNGNEMSQETNNEESSYIFSSRQLECDESSNDSGLDAESYRSKNSDVAGNMNEDNGRSKHLSTINESIDSSVFHRQGSTIPLCIIVTQSEYKGLKKKGGWILHKSPSFKQGMLADEKRVEEMLAKHGFHNPYCWQNKKVQHIKEKLQRLSENIYESLVCIILSRAHGNHIYDNDENDLDIFEVVRIFTEKPAWRGIRKLFITRSCQLKSKNSQYLIQKEDEMSLLWHCMDTETWLKNGEGSACIRNICEQLEGCEKGNVTEMINVMASIR